MRRRISQIAKGKFEYAKPVLAFSEDQLNLMVIEGKEVTGDFIIRSDNHIPVRGVVYSTNPRMECLTPQFEGDEVKIRYQFNSSGLLENKTEDGIFAIICNGCEYSIPYKITVMKHYPESSIGTIRNLYDFSCLAKENWSEAYQLFYHSVFSNIISDKEIKEMMVYKGIISAKPSNQNLEEFLIGIRKKEQIDFTLDKSNEKYYEVRESFKEIVNIKKSTWGYIEIKVETDCDFIKFTKNRIVTDDFMGSIYQFDYYIDVDKLHSGHNYGKIYFTSPYESKCVEIFADKEAYKEDTGSTFREIQEYRVGIMELYQAYRLKKIVTGVWANETIEILNSLHGLEPDNKMYLLMKAQALIINRQRQEAEWILDDFKRVYHDKKSPTWGYYLYLMTLMEREPSYVDKMTYEIEMIFRENPDSVLLFWILTFLKEEYYNDNSRKLKAIEYWVLKGYATPFLYIEAFYLIWQDPYLLSKLDTFEIRVLRWAAKQHALTKDLAMQIFHIVEMSKGFNPVIYELMCDAYEVDSRPENVGIICSYLIKGQIYGEKYFHWYELGIELELRITGLYEAYVISMDERRVTPIPKIIQMYFQYESTLPYEKTAVLYNNIIASKESNPDMYNKYRKIMGTFAMEQVEMGHMDDNLAVVYDDMLDLGFINREISRDLANIIFTNKLVVFDENMVKAIIYQRQMKEPQIVQIKDSCAYFQLFSNEYVILFENNRGQRFVGSVTYQLQKLMDSDKYIDKCIEFSPDEINYVIAKFNTKQSYLTFNESDEQFFPRIIFGEEISDEYKALMIPEVMRYYQGTSDTDTVKEFLANIDYGKLSIGSRKYLMDMLIWYKMFDLAYDKIQEYGIEQVGSGAKATLATYLIEKNENEEDEFLIKLSLQSFMEKQNNEKIILYLINYYNGPTYIMVNIWKAAREYNLDTFELEERILVQMMYSDVILDDANMIFERYYETGGRELIVLAFITECAHRYFVNEINTSSLIFEIIQERYLSRMELNDACKLGLLRYISELTIRSKVQYRIEDELLSEYTCRNMNFAFFKKLDHELVMKYYLYDKVFLEYRANPESHVVLHYSRDEDGEEFVAEDMPDVYDGIFVKQFVMFFGETLQYYITEEYNNQVEVTESSRIMNNDMYSIKDKSRYNLINQMLISTTLQDEASLYQNMKQYDGLDEVTKRVFKIL